MMEFVKGVLIIMALPVLPFVGTIAIGMIYSFVLSLFGYDYNLREAFEKCAAFAFKPMLYCYYLVLFALVLVLLGFDPSVI